MLKNSIILNKTGTLSSQAGKIQGRYFLFILLFFLAAMLFQPFIETQGSLHQQLIPALAVITLMIVYFFNMNGLVISLAANTAAGVVAFNHWLVSQETVYPVLIALLFYTSVASAVITYFKDREQTKKENLEWLSAVDFLTETYNHRFFQLRLSEEVARARRSGQPLSLVFVDIDHFKQYNDLNGHVMGDLALKKSAAFLNKKTRIHDVVCRYGGDEFVIILPDSSAENAMIFAERLVKNYSQLVFPSKNSKAAALSLSVGISDYPRRSSCINDLIAQADKALFLAKEAGRNQARVYEAADTGDEVQSKSFCYNNCKDELVESYHKLIRDLSYPDNGKKVQDSILNRESIGNKDGNGKGNGGVNQNLLVGRALGAGHSNIDRNRLTSCLEGLKVH